MVPIDVENLRDLFIAFVIVGSVWELVRLFY